MPAERDVFLRTVQSHVARASVVASAVRGKGNSGVVIAARGLLRQLDLTRFGVDNEKRFAGELNRLTLRLCEAFPRGARHWGLARKVANIFLRDCLYNTYLAEAHRLKRAEQLFELPIDSYTYKALKALIARRQLPLWPRVRHLTPELNIRLQMLAQEHAERKGMARVHLDALWWSAARDVDVATDDELE